MIGILYVNIYKQNIYIMTADDLQCKDPGYQQPWYKLCFPGIFGAPIQ